MNLVSQKSKRARVERSLEEIAQDLRKGRAKEASFRLLFDAFYPKLFRFFRNGGVSSREDIRDLIQNTFLKVYKHREQFRDSQKIASWIFRIGRNNMIDWLRNKRTLNKDKNPDKSAEMDEINSDSDLLQQTIHREQVQIVLQAIERLPARKRECLLMWAAGYSYHDIATALRISPETVKSQLYQGRKRLQQMLRQLLDEFEF